jgi:hypothetical protein
MDKPVVDMMGIHGSFDIELACSLDSLSGMRLGSPRDAAAAPSILAKTLVIDSVEEVPTENWPGDRLQFVEGHRRRCGVIGIGRPEWLRPPDG